MSKKRKTRKRTEKKRVRPDHNLQIAFPINRAGWKFADQALGRFFDQEWKRKKILSEAEQNKTCVMCGTGDIEGVVLYMLCDLGMFETKGDKVIVFSHGAHLNCFRDSSFSFHMLESIRGEIFDMIQVYSDATVDVMSDCLN